MNEEEFQIKAKELGFSCNGRTYTFGSCKAILFNHARYDEELKVQAIHYVEVGGEIYFCTAIQEVFWIIGTVST